MTLVNLSIESQPASAWFALIALAIGSLVLRWATLAPPPAAPQPVRVRR